MVSIIEDGEEMAEENDRLIISLSQTEENYVGVADSDEQDQLPLITAANKLSVEEVEKHLQNEDFAEEIKNEAILRAAFSGEVGVSKDDEKTVGIITALQRSGAGVDWRKADCLMMTSRRMFSSRPSTSYDYMVANQGGVNWAKSRICTAVWAGVGAAHKLCEHGGRAPM